MDDPSTNSRRPSLARQRRTRNVSAAQARSYLSKAEEYLAAAENELTQDCVLRVGTRRRGQQDPVDQQDLVRPRSGIDMLQPDIPKPPPGDHMCDSPATSDPSGALGWNRTSDTRFRKPVLYPLSYEGGLGSITPRVSRQSLWRSFGRERRCVETLDLAAADQSVNAEGCSANSAA